MLFHSLGTSAATTADPAAKELLRRMASAGALSCVADALQRTAAAPAALGGGQRARKGQLCECESRPCMCLAMWALKLVACCVDAETAKLAGESGLVEAAVAVAASTRWEPEAADSVQGAAAAALAALRAGHEANGKREAKARKAAAAAAPARPASAAVAAAQASGDGAAALLLAGVSPLPVTPVEDSKSELAIARAIDAAASHGDALAVAEGKARLALACMQTQPTDPPEAIRLARDCLRPGRGALADSHAPAGGAAHFALGKALLVAADGERAQAVEPLQMAYAIAKRNSDGRPLPYDIRDTLLPLGQALGLAGRFAEAEKALKECIVSQPPRTDRASAAWGALGQVLAQAGKHADALVALEEGAGAHGRRGGGARMSDDRRVCLIALANLREGAVGGDEGTAGGRALVVDRGKAAALRKQVATQLRGQPQRECPVCGGQVRPAEATPPGGEALNMLQCGHVTHKGCESAFGMECPLCHSFVPGSRGPAAAQTTVGGRAPPPSGAPPPPAAAYTLTLVSGELKSLPPGVPDRAPFAGSGAAARLPPAGGGGGGGGGRGDGGSGLSFWVGSCQQFESESSGEGAEIISCDPETGDVRRVRFMLAKSL